MRYARFVCRREAESLSGPNDLPVSIKEKRARIVVAVLTRTAETVGAGIAPSASLSDQDRSWQRRPKNIAPCRP
jgi:hypothetical protein